MKKFICFIFICSLSLGFVACGGDDDEEDNDKDKFTWNGDWNDPSDPNYKPEEYNPIEGKWRNKNDKTKGYEFTEGRAAYSLVLYENGSEDGIRISPDGGYMINNTAFKTKDEIWAYKLDKAGNTLSLAFPPNYNKWTDYEKITE
ncbi:hypothetical protein GGR21_003464 [Dysgonomonas hofstadii]|uniref:Lipocalin-like domain-containing protein n=1 Tax=Dysgonomonas hofstadii TaxID=637886 RepID=A0A840CN82_9BACT|nr:hypothetical protein [Dysgonomonas hofstadii]MBB4037547.1 hypothetical protein [Dysgonomonas hofstadii]